MRSLSVCVYLFFLKTGGLLHTTGMELYADCFQISTVGVFFLWQPHSLLLSFRKQSGSLVSASPRPLAEMYLHDESTTSQAPSCPVVPLASPENFGSLDRRHTDKRTHAYAFQP